MRNFVPVSLGYRGIDQPFDCLRVIYEGIINCEHDALHTEFGRAALEGRGGEKSTCGDVKVFTKAITEEGRRSPLSGERLIDSPKKEWNSLSEMTKDNLGLRTFTEDAAQDETDSESSGLNRKTPG